MDQSRFDHFAQVVGRRCGRRAIVAAFGGGFAAGFVALPTVGAKRKKHKKKCARKCQDGCCTSKFGRCIRPEQQSSAQCGTGGAICQSGQCVPCSTTLPCPVGQCCTDAGTCGPCTAFVTTTKHNGNLAGLSGADAICQNQANLSGLPGVYMAWLADASGSPSSRFTKATVPYTLVNGATVAANWNALSSGALAHAVDTTETGLVLPFAEAGVWTGALANGTAAPAGCLNWTSASNAGPQGLLGIATMADAKWSSYTSLNCDQMYRLYCFQQR